MSVLRLVSSVTQKEFVIMKRHIEGYSLDLKNENLTLFSASCPIELTNNTVNHWDNWDEFIKGVRLWIEDQDNFF